MKKPARRFNFTKHQIDLLQSPAKGVTYHYDTTCRGLAISVGTTGRKNFVLYRKVRGRPLRRTIGPYPDLSIEAARRRAMELNVEIARGLDPFRLAPKNELPTLREAFKKYYEEYSKVHKLTHEEDQAHFLRHVDTKWHGLKLADKRLDEITPGDIRQLHLALGNADKKTTANRIIALLSSIFSQLRRWGDFEGPNPCLGVRRYPERSRERFIRPTEMPRFLRAVDAEPNEVARDFFLGSLFTAARKGNVQAMRWDDVDLERRVWRIPRTKNGDSQHVQLADAAVELLKRRLESRVAQPPQSAFVFPGSGKSGYLVEPKKAWRRVLERATAYGFVEELKKAGASQSKIERLAKEAESNPSELLACPDHDARMIAAAEMRDLHLHDLRRTSGAWLASSGTSLTVIAKALNHKSLTATQVYARVWNDAVKEAVQSVTTAFLATRQ